LHFAVRLILSTIASRALNFESGTCSHTVSLSIFIGQPRKQLHYRLIKCQSLMTSIL